MTFEITPPLVSGDPMLPETKALIEEFLEQAPEPIHLLLYASKLNEMDWTLSRPCIHLPGADLQHGVPIRNFEKLKDNPLFSKMLHHVLADEKIEFSIRKLQPDQDMNLQLGNLHLLVMPGALRLSYPLPLRLVNLFHNTPQGRENLPAHNLGTFMAGRYETAHEQLTAMQNLMAVKSIWGPFHHSFNQHMKEVGGPYRMTDPKPGSQAKVIAK